MAQVHVTARHRCFGGEQVFYTHDSAQTGLPMRFSVYLPPAAQRGLVPALFFLAGLTCNETTFAIKAGAQRVASQLGLALVCPDTSPRGANVPGEADNWDFGLAASFYLDATKKPWSDAYRMESWLRELRHLLISTLPFDSRRIGICGHSMGGHGALIMALRNPGIFQSLSAIAPVASPLHCPWGRKAFEAYLGPDVGRWREHDASELMRRRLKAAFPAGILIDQGADDEFMNTQLHPEAFVAACEAAQQPLQFRMHAGYDHGYYFIQSVIEDHLRFHAERLAGV